MARRIAEGCTLEGAVPGWYAVVSLEGGKSFLRKLESLGIHTGVTIEVLSSAAAGGPARVSLGGAQFGIGHGMASRIHLAPAGPPAAVLPRRTLRDLREGESGRILRVGGEGKFRKRLQEMGFVKGAEVYVEKYAPLRDPVEYIIKGYHVSLRRDEAEKVVMAEPER